VPIALLVIGFVLVRPTLQEQWTRWRAENPWVDQVPGVAAVLRDMVGGAAGSDGAASDTRSGRPRNSKSREGVNDKAAMPPDLPIWPRPQSETFSAGNGHAAAYQQVSAPSDSVLRYFRRSMPAKGWRLDKERKGAGGVLLLYRKGDRMARVEVVTDAAGTEVWLRSRVATGAPEE